MSLAHSPPQGAQVVFRDLRATDPVIWLATYSAFVADIRRDVRAAMPSFDPAHGWRGCSDRVLLRNTFADVGITTADGIASVWIAERDDRTYRLRCEWIGRSAQARAWLAEIAPDFETVTARIGCIPMPGATGDDIHWPQAA